MKQLSSRYMQLISLLFFLDTLIYLYYSQANLELGGLLHKVLVEVTCYGCRHAICRLPFAEAGGWTESIRKSNMAANPA